MQFCLVHNESWIAIRSQFQRDMTLIQWETMKNRRLEGGISSSPANWMWNCSLKSLPEASGLITAPWQAKRNIANQIHKKVGHLLSRANPCFLCALFTSDLSYHSLLSPPSTFYARQEVDYSSQTLSLSAEHNDRSLKLSRKLRDINTFVPIFKN